MFSSNNLSGKFWLLRPGIRNNGVRITKGPLQYISNVFMSLFPSSFLLIFGHSSYGYRIMRHDGACRSIPIRDCLLGFHGTERHTAYTIFAPQRVAYRN